MRRLQQEGRSAHPTVMMVPAMADLSRASAVDAGAFTDRLESVLDSAHRLATVMLRDRAAAEDAVQEAALKAWTKWGQLRGGEGAFRGWFLSIVANECRMARRTRWWHVIRSAEPVEDPARVDRAFAGSDLRDAVLRLDPSDRAALFCFFYLDLPMDEVARVLGISASAARTRVYRAARRLRPALDPSEDLR
jgi:RNA polymerase sigma-70 factor, ECF subfamily